MIMEQPLQLYVTRFCDFTQVYTLPIQIKEWFPNLDQKGNLTNPSVIQEMIFKPIF